MLSTVASLRELLAGDHRQPGQPIDRGTAHAQFAEGLHFIISIVLVLSRMGLDALTLTECSDM